MGKILKFSMLVCMLSAANAWGAVFLDDFNRADGPVANGWTILTNGTVTSTIISNEVLVAGTEATDWARCGLQRVVVGETKVSCDAKWDNGFNFHFRIDAQGSSAFVEAYTWPGGALQHANSADGSWPGWVAFNGANAQTNAGQYNHIELEVTPGKVTVTLNGKLVETLSNAGFTSTIRQVTLASDAAAGTTGSIHIDNVLIGKIIAGKAKDPNPDSVSDVPRDGTLSWTAGEYAQTHNVYLGTSFDDANTADLSKAASKGQTGTTFQPTDLFEYGKTYFWRVDEVNAAPSNTVFKGDVWSFTAEPYAYPITGVTATASSFEKATTPAANTVNGSGMTGDVHGINTTTMWNTSMAAAAAGPAWIQYQFDNAYKLSEMWVWNYNGEFEPVLGYGFKDVTIEYSLDGQTWTLLKEAQFAQATAVGSYAHNTTVDMGGVVAQYVKLTAKSNWSMVGLKQYGLSEVRFYHIPAQARAPQPSAGAVDVSVDSSLDWRSGRDMTSEQVYFGTDQAAVAGGTAAAKTVSGHGFTPEALNFGTTYYWKVDEVGTATYPGALWSFTTQEFAAVDDFESYTDDEGSRIYEAWIDGWTNNTGSVVGYLQSPFAETTVVHGGEQAMPFEYNNIKTPYYSETERTFDTPQDWTTNGADSVALYYQGFPAGFTDKGGNAFTVVSTGTDIWNNADQFRFAYKSLSGNGSITAKVESVTRSDAWSKAGVMIRESLDAGSKHAMAVLTPDNGASLQYRNSTGGASANADAAGIKTPYWVRITRTGNTFKAERSADGKAWTQIGTDQNITMVTNVYVGLCVTSHNANAYSTAEFSNVATTGTGSWQSASIGVAQRSNGVAPMYLTVEDKAGKKKTVVNPDAAAVTKGTWTQWQIPLADLSGVNVAAVKKLTIGVGDPANPKAGAAGMLYIDDIQYGKAAVVGSVQP